VTDRAGIDVFFTFVNLERRMCCGCVVPDLRIQKNQSSCRTVSFCGSKDYGSFNFEMTPANFTKIFYSHDAPPVCLLV
jgi:hypothetical protein